MIKLKKLFIYFFLVGTTHAFIASEGTTIHSSSVPSAEKLVNNFKETIHTYKLKRFALIGGNTLYTNVPNLANLITVVNKLIKRQDSLFRPKSKPYNLILIDNAKASTIEGIAKGKDIVVEGDFKKDPKDYIRVISHELVHRYIGHLLKQPQENETRYKWFFEGFTEFFAVKSLIDIKLIDEGEYLNLINSSLEEWINHLSINIGFEQLARTRQPINYTKGFILAFIIDEQLKKMTQGKYDLQSIINNLISEIISKKTHFTLNLLIEYLKEHLPQSFIERILIAIEDSRTLTNLLPSQFFTKNLSLKSIERYGNICFNVSNSLKSRKIQGVILKSDCYIKGLRNNQELKCSSINFNNGNIKLKVLDANKREKILYLKASKVKSNIPVYH